MQSRAIKNFEVIHTYSQILGLLLSGQVTLDKTLTLSDVSISLSIRQRK